MLALLGVFLLGVMTPILGVYIYFRRELSHKVPGFLNESWMGVESIVNLISTSVMASHHENSSQFRVLNEDTAQISFKGEDGKTYIVWVPYDRRLKSMWSEFQLKCDQGTTHPHHPGVPVLRTPQQLGKTLHLHDGYRVAKTFTGSDKVHPEPDSIDGGVSMEDFPDD
jgi:hypothetical protein